MASDAPPQLSSEQLHAFFDILNHNETYLEAENFKHSNAVQEYGYPFTAAEAPSQGTHTPIYASESSAPLLQLFLTKCILSFPGVSSLPPDFWHTNFQGIMRALADANLSESYDKGTLGTRKTLATGASVIHEALTRGLLSGVPRGGRIDLKKAKYDTMQAPELERAWNECMHELIHGNLADEMFEHCATTADFEGHSSAMSAAADYVILHLASLLHHVFVSSAEGQYLLKLVENVYNLMPFSIVRQTLRIGNAATMLNGMIRVFLAKMGVGAVTNWFGITSGADDGMNLLQRIISMVLTWDASEFRKQTTASEASKNHPPKPHLVALKSYIALPRDAHDALREISTSQHISIVAAILDASDPSLTESLTPAQHTQCLEWLAGTLSARDRDEITRVLCKSQPDHLTAAVRGAVGAYEPMIRTVHESLDLRVHLTALEAFVADFIETSRPKKVKGAWRPGSKAKKDDSRPPSVEEYVTLLRRHKGYLFAFVHDFAKGCTGLRGLFQHWVNLVVREFRQPADGDGTLDAKLQALYADLPAEDKEEVRASVDAHAAYLARLNALSRQRMQRVLDQLAKDAISDEDTSGKTSKAGSKAGSKPSSKAPSKNPTPAASPRTSSSGPSMSGPGVYLMRWDALLDATPITPAMASGGEVRFGRDVKGVKALGKTAAEGAKGGWDAGALAREEDAGVPVEVDGRGVMEVLGAGWRGVVRGFVGKVGDGEEGEELGVGLGTGGGEEAVLAA